MARHAKDTSENLGCLALVLAAIVIVIVLAILGTTDPFHLFDGK